MTPNDNLRMVTKHRPQVVEQLDLGRDLRFEVERLKVGRWWQAWAVSNVADGEEIDGWGKSRRGSRERSKEGVIIANKAWSRGGSRGRVSCGRSDLRATSKGYPPGLPVGGYI